MTTPTQSPKPNANAASTLVAEPTATASAATIVTPASATVTPVAANTPTDSKNATTASVTVTTVPTSTTATPVSVTGTSTDNKSTITVTSTTTPPAKANIGVDTSAATTATTVTATIPASDNKSAAAAPTEVKATTGNVSIFDRLSARLFGNSKSSTSAAVVVDEKNDDAKKSAAAKAIVAIAKQHEESNEFVDAIKYYRNALFANPAEKSILKNIEAVQKKLKNNTPDQDKIKYYIACAKIRASTTNPDKFATTLAEEIIRIAFENKSATNLLKFLEADADADVKTAILTKHENNQIRENFFRVLVPVVSKLKDPVNDLAANSDAHLLAALKKYGAQFTVEFLAASFAWDARQKFPVLVRTFFQTDLLNNLKLHSEFKVAVLATFTKPADRKLIIDEIKRQFNQLAIAQIDEYRNKAYRDKEKRSKKANALEAINHALHVENADFADFADVLALIAVYQQDTKAVMNGTVTATLLNGLKLALNSLGYEVVAKVVASAAVTAAPEAVTPAVSKSKPFTRTNFIESALKDIFPATETETATATATNISQLITEYAEEKIPATAPTAGLSAAASGSTLSSTTTASAVASDATPVLPPVVTANGATTTVTAPTTLATPAADIGGTASVAVSVATLPFLSLIKSL